MRYFILLCLALFLWAEEKLPPLEAKLYSFIKQDQILSHPIERYIGTWPTYPKYTGARKEIPESNSFMTLQTLMLLHQVDENYELEGIDEVYALAEKQVQHYVEDAEKTDEAKGTISFWPLIQTEDGEWIRSFDTQWYNTSMRILNVGNDFDTSSQAFAWFYTRDKNRAFLDSFVESLGDYVDANRKSEHPSNLRWKKPETGAFLTWAEQEAPDKPINRIMDLVNDVDGVVNLNILTALSYYENNIGPLPKKTQEAKKQSCKLIHNIIVNEQEDVCGTWYTRRSHFYLAFAKAYKADTFCIEEDKETVLSRAKERSKYLLKHPSMRSYAEIAEYIIILKSLKEKKYRQYFYNKLISDLEKELKKGITQRDGYAYLPSKQSLFGGEAFGLFYFNWYGRSNATALALRALSMK